MVSRVAPHVIAVSIRASREGGDLQRNSPMIPEHKFQSAPPVREATIARVNAGGNAYVSIRASREGGDSCNSCDPRC